MSSELRLFASIFLIFLELSVDLTSCCSSSSLFEEFRFGCCSYSFNSQVVELVSELLGQELFDLLLHLLRFFFDLITDHFSFESMLVFDSFSQHLLIQHFSVLIA